MPAVYGTPGTHLLTAVEDKSSVPIAPQIKGQKMGTKGQCSYSGVTSRFKGTGRKNRLTVWLPMVNVTPAPSQVGLRPQRTHFPLGCLLENSGSKGIFSARRKYMGPNNKIFKFTVSHIEIQTEILFIPLLLCVLPSHSANVAYIRSWDVIKCQH